MAFTKLIDRFPELLALSESRTAGALDRAASDIVAGAMSRSRVDTGMMRAGWTSEELNRHSRMIFNPVVHTIFNEYGTVNMSAQPMLRPALEEVTPRFIADVRRAWYGA